MVTKHLSDSFNRLRRPYSVEVALRKSQKVIQSFHSSQQALDVIKSVKQDIANEATRLTVLNQQRKQLLAHKSAFVNKIRQVHGDIQSIKRRHEAVFNESCQIQQSLEKVDVSRKGQRKEVNQLHRNIAELSDFNDHAKKAIETLKAKISEEKRAVKYIRSRLRGAQSMAHLGKPRRRCISVPKLRRVAKHSFLA